MTDRYQAFASSSTGPATAGFAITPNDDTDMVEACRALYVGITGDIKLTLTSGDTLLLQNVQQGTVIPLRAIRIFQTGTTASGMVALV